MNMNVRRVSLRDKIVDSLTDSIRTSGGTPAIEPLEFMINPDGSIMISPDGTPLEGI